MTQHQADGVSELKPCPFCEGGDNPFTYEDWPDWYVQCGSCDTRTGNFGAEAEAITAWNTRALDPVLADMREALAMLERRRLDALSLGGSSEIGIEEIDFIIAALSRSERKGADNG